MSSTQEPLSGQDFEAELASHVPNSSSTTTSRLLPAESLGELASSSDAAAASEIHCSEIEESFAASKSGLALDTLCHMQSARSMQTPPPTSTSATRRRAQKAQMAKLVQQSAASRRMSAPLFPKIQTAGTAAAVITDGLLEQFPAVEFSPDAFEYLMSGPATAPIYPQQRLFWDLKNDDGMILDLSNPFEIQQQSTLDPFVSDHYPQPVSQAAMTCSFMDFSADEATDLSAKALTSSIEHAAFNPTAGSVRNGKSISRTVANSVDPNLLFSSPSKPSELAAGAGLSKIILDEESLQPYAYQVQEAKREKASDGIPKPKKRRKPDCDSPAVKSALEILRDSDSNNPRPEIVITDPAPDSSTEPKRRAPSISRNETNRLVGRQAAVAFTIDANGRARTETRTVVGSSDDVQDGIQIELDNSSDDTGSTVSSDQSQLALAASHAMSFEFSAELPKIPKIGRFVANSKTHSQKSSYASIHTVSSNTSGIYPAFSPAKSSIPTEPSSMQPYLGTLSFGLSDGHDRIENHSNSDVEIVVDSEDGGNAQSELKKVLSDRNKGNSTRRGKRPNPKPKGKPAHQLVSPPKIYTGSLDLHINSTPSHGHGSVSTVSPTTVIDPELVALGSNRTVRVAYDVRCVCNVTSNDPQMISW